MSTKTRRNEALDYYEYVDCILTIELALLIGKHKDKHRAVKTTAIKLSKRVESNNIKQVMLFLAYNKMPYTKYRKRVTDITAKFPLIDFIEVGYAYKDEAFPELT